MAKNGDQESRSSPEVRFHGYDRSIHLLYELHGISPSRGNRRNTCRDSRTLHIFARLRRADRSSAGRDCRARSQLSTFDCKMSSEKGECVQRGPRPGRVCFCYFREDRIEQQHTDLRHRAQAALRDSLCTFGNSQRQFKNTEVRVILIHATALSWESAMTAEYAQVTST